MGWDLVVSGKVKWRVKEEEPEGEKAEGWAGAWDLERQAGSARSPEIRPIV